MRAEPWHSDRPRLGTFYGLTIWFRPPLIEGFAITMGFSGASPHHRWRLHLNPLVLNVSPDNLVEIGFSLETQRTGARSIQVPGPSFHDSHDRRVRFPANQFDPVRARAPLQTLDHLAHRGGQSGHRKIPSITNQCAIDFSRAKEKPDRRTW